MTVPNFRTFVGRGEIVIDEETGKTLIGYTWWTRAFGQLWTYPDLIAQGWTASRIDTLLGEPDAYGRNPGGGWVRLYAHERVARALLQDIEKHVIPPLSGQSSPTCKTKGRRT